MRPLLGCAFAPDEGQSSGARHALLSEEFWRRRFAADPGVVGTTLTIDGTSPRSTHPFLTLGRLAPGATLAGAQAKADPMQVLRAE